MEALCCTSTLESPANGFAAFEPLALETKALYDRYIDRLPDAVTSPLYFHSLYAWNFVAANRYKIIDGHMCFVVDDALERETYALPPLGELGDSFVSAARAVAREFEREGFPRCVFREVPGFMLPYLSAVGGYRAEVTCDRNWSDYIYTRDALAKGLQRGPFRASRRDFERTFLPSAREMGPYDKDIAREVTQKFFCAERDCSSCFCGCELEVTSRLMASWDALGLKGVVVESGGTALAFGIVCFQKNNAFFISKKLRRHTRGLDQYLTTAMMESIFSGYEYINYSDDLGNEGLREYKSVLAKHTLNPRYTVRLFNE